MNNPSLQRMVFNVGEKDDHHVERIPVIFYPVENSEYIINKR